jgi:sugar lactone lactonase YvrE
MKPASFSNNKQPCAPRGPLCLALVAFLACGPLAHGDTFYVSSGNDLAGWSVLKGDSTGDISLFSPPVGSWISGMAIDASGALYASVLNGNAVYRFDRAGNSTVFARTDSPCGLTFDSSGNLYVAGRNNNTITRVSPDGSKSVFASTGLSTPFDLAFDGNGNLYAGNQGNGTIVRFDLSGNPGVFASGVYNPKGLAFDGAGHLYVATSTSVVRYDAQAKATTFANLGYPNYAGDIAFGSSGNLYVQDLNVQDGSGRVLVLDTGGHASVVVSGLQRPTSLAVEPIPEPCTFALAGLGASALIARRRR